MKPSHLKEIYDQLFVMAKAVMLAGVTGDESQIEALRAAIIGLEPSVRAAIVKQLDSPERLTRIQDFARITRGRRDLMKRALEGRNKFGAAMVEEFASEIIWSLAIDERLPPYLA